MQMHIVRITGEIVVVTQEDHSEEYAMELAQAALYSDELHNEIGFGVRAKNISRVAALPEGWHWACVPYGENDTADTIEEIFAAQDKEPNTLKVTQLKRGDVVKSIQTIYTHLSHVQIEPGTIGVVFDDARPDTSREVRWLNPRLTISYIHDGQVEKLEWKSST